MELAPRAVPHTAGSMTVDGDRKCVADRPHPFVAQAPEAVGEDADRHALDRVEVDVAESWNRIGVGLENHLAGQSPDGGGARGDQGSAESGYRSISTQHDDGSAADARQFTPPELATPRLVAHEAAAASRNDARSPHSSTSSTGCSSYAAYALSISALPQNALGPG